MADNRKVLFGLLILAIFVSAVFYLPHFFETNAPLVCFEEGVCQHEEYLNSIIALTPAILILGFVFGVVASFLYFERRVEIPSAPPDRSAALLMLHPIERKIIKRIIDEGGSALQSDISRLEGVGKVKAHRVVDKLIRRGVLEKEEKGKTNVLKLKKEIKDALG